MVDDGNPAPKVFRRWHILSPYDDEWCAVCPDPVLKGELINIEYENGVSHAACTDPDWIG